jgi:murein L,D-transpeptidase YafK
MSVTLPLKILLAGCLLIAAIAAAPQRRTSIRPMPDASNNTAVTLRIVVKKRERKLYLYRVESGKPRLAKTYRIALGSTPVGHKQRQGDGATPEGEYYITHHNPKSNFYLSLGLSYPNASDAKAGLARGLISQAEYEAIMSAINAGSKPPQNTKLGGDIFIHGGGASQRRDWTLGCVALDNEDIKELFETVPAKTPVRIEP